MPFNGLFKDKKKLDELRLRVGTGDGQTTDEGEQNRIKPIALGVTPDDQTPPPQSNLAPVTLSPPPRVEQPLPSAGGTQPIQPHRALDLSNPIEKVEQPNINEIRGVTNPVQTEQQPAAVEETPKYNPVSASAGTEAAPVAPLDLAQQRIQDAKSAPKEKISKWKNIAAIAIQAADAIYNGNQRQIKGLGQIRHDNAVAKAQGEYNEIKQVEDDKANLGIKNANIERIKTAPANRLIEIEKKYQNTIKTEGAKQIGRLQVIAEQYRLKGQSVKFDTAKDGTGRIVMIDGNGNQTFVKNEQGEFEYNLREKPIETQVADGTNADGTPRYKNVQLTSKEFANFKESQDYHDELLALNKERIAETKRSNITQEKLSAERLAQQRDQFVTAMREKNRSDREKGLLNIVKLKAEYKKDLEEKRLDLESYNVLINDLDNLK